MALHHAVGRFNQQFMKFVRRKAKPYRLTNDLPKLVDQPPAMRFQVVAHRSRGDECPLPMSHLKHAFAA
jgi:hypothetical protein